MTKLVQLVLSWDVYFLVHILFAIFAFLRGPLCSLLSTNRKRFSYEIEILLKIDLGMC